MTPKRQRLVFVLLALISATIATLMILNALKDNLVFFFTPTDLEQKKPAPSQLVRLGGLVAKDSVKQDGDKLSFIVTDMQKSITTSFTGTPPALFREGQGVVAEGYLVSPEKFQAKKLLAKHDENYMPPEVADALKKSGHWEYDTHAR